MSTNVVPVEKRSFDNEKMWLVLIIVIATIFRLLRLGSESFWLDEAYTAVLIQKAPSEIILGAANDVYPPLHYLVLFAVSKLLGGSEFALRLPSVIFGLLSIIAIWKLGKLLFDTKIALFAAFLLAISPFGISYSQEARTYSLLLFTFLCSYLFFIRLSRKVTTLDIVGYSLSILISIWSHSIGIVLVALQIFCIALEGLVWRKLDIPWKPWIISLALPGITFLPWLSTMFTQYQKVSSGNFWVQPPSFSNFLSFLQSSIGSTIGFILVVPLLMVFIIIWIKETEVRILAYWGVFIPFAIWLFSVFVAPIFTIRNVFPALPAILLILAKIFMSIKYKPLSLAAILIFIAGCIMTNYSYFTIPQKAQWRDASAYLQTHAEKNATIVFEQNYGIYGIDAYLDLSEFKQSNSPDNQSWIVIYDVKPKDREKLITGREVTDFNNVILAHPISTTP